MHNAHPYWQENRDILNFLMSRWWGWRERRSLEARGPTEARLGRKAETDWVCEGISEGVLPGRAREGRAGRCRSTCQAPPPRHFTASSLRILKLVIRYGQAGPFRLPIDVFAVLEGEHVQPLGTNTAVEYAIGPDPAGPNLVFLEVTFQRFAVERMFGQVTESFFDSFSCGVVTILEVFEGLRCETDLPHCSSPNAALKE
mgnify:CR=1 FL=1